MRPHIALVTCLTPPEPDPDEAALCAALVARGARVTLAPWDAAPFAGLEADLCVLRSTWNYAHARDAFVAWARATAARVPLRNGPEVVAWNTHKSYLRALAERGVPTAPTRFLERGDATTLRALLDETGWSDVVLKPQVGAGSLHTRRFARATLDEGEAFLRARLAERAMLAQPYLRSVDEYGERSLVWIDGALSHAVRKSPRLAGEHEEVSAAVPVADDERALAERVLEPYARELLYARVDLARDDGGAPLLMELELVEPSLFLQQHPPALARFADALVAAASRAPC